MKFFLKKCSPPPKKNPGYAHATAPWKVNLAGIFGRDAVGRGSHVRISTFMFPSYICFIGVWDKPMENFKIEISANKANFLLLLSMSRLVFKELSLRVDGTKSNYPNYLARIICEVLKENLLK